MYKNAIHKLTRTNKPDYYKRHIEKHKNNSKKTWDAIRSIITLRANSHKQTKRIAETFNNFFVTIARDKDSKIIHTKTNYKDSVLN